MNYYYFKNHYIRLQLKNRLCGS